VPVSDANPVPIEYGDDLDLYAYVGNDPTDNRCVRRSLVATILKFKSQYCRCLDRQTNGA